MAAGSRSAAAPRSSTGWCHYSFGWIAMGRGEVAAALAEFEASVALAGPDDLVRPHALAALAPLLALTGDRDRAAKSAADALSSARAFPLPGVHVMALVRVAQTRVLCGDDAVPGSPSPSCSTWCTAWAPSSSGQRRPR